MDKGEWRATVHGVTQSQTGLRDTLLLLYVIMDKQLILFVPQYPHL